MAAYTSDTLLTSIELKSFAPEAQTTFASSEILAMASEIMLNVIVPAIILKKTDYFVFTKDFTITASISNYTVPARAINGILRAVFYLGDNGQICELDQLDLNDPTTTSESSPYAYYFEDDQIVLYPTPVSTQGTLRVKSFVGSGELVTADAGAVITAINTSTNVVTVGTIPSTWVTGNSFDLIAGTGNHAYRDLDLTSTLVSGTAITLPSLPVKLAVGDYINLAGECSLVQLPSSFRAALAHLTAAEMLSSQNQPGVDTAQAKGKAYLQNALDIINPRSKGKPKVIGPRWF